MPFDGSTPGPGRPKGSQNKSTKAFKDAVLRAYEGIGGDAAFQKWAKKNPTEFYRIASRLIPNEVTSDPDKPVIHKVIFGGRYKPTA
jgi:hypothetical protein